MALFPPLSHCAALVRDHDHDRYLCALFVPPQVRESWFALFAFNHEIAAIPELVSEEMIGFMRFAWWREALDEIYAGSIVRKHPVVQALAEAITRHQLSRAPFDALLDGREKRFANPAMQQRAEWEAYFRATSSSLLALCAQAACLEYTPAIEQLGIAWGCIGMARVFARAGDSESKEQLQQAGQEWLNNARDAIMPELFLPFSDTAGFYLKRLKAGKNPSHEALVLLPLTLCWHRVIRRFLPAIK